MLAANIVPAATQVLDLSHNEVSLLSDLDTCTSLETLLVSSNLLQDQASVAHLRVGEA
jgi:Leucine-rich repeat (LRR) protein